MLYLYISLLICLMNVNIASAAFVQYRTDNDAIYAVSDDTLYPRNGYSVIEIEGPADSNIAFPPPVGCTNSDWHWLDINPNANPPSFSLKSGLVFFHCQLVQSALDVDRVVESLIFTNSGNRSSIDILNLAVNVLGVLLLQCPTDGISTECDAARTDALATQSSILLPLQTYKQSLLVEATSFKASQGW